ncbi:hypothetical protein VSK92_18265 [Bacillus swezeyi]|uniref:hypothetical protein n=1 Tax=Bacillus swezeyi TaxID=1925020 RepID=UPI0039C5B0B8
MCEHIINRFGKLTKQIKYESAPFTLVNNGHTVQANARTKSSSIFIEGHQYKLV